MKEIDDKLFDELIVAAFEKQEMMAEIEKSVMQTIKREKRRTQWLFWLKVVAFYFGFPFFILSMIGCAVYLVKAFDYNLGVVGSMMMFVLTMIWLSKKALLHFDERIGCNN